MCGLAGCYYKNSEIDTDKFEKMVDIIEHRGPNDRGTFYEGKVALGHRRLSIIDLTSAGHQPFFYKDQYVIVYNGEIYNYCEMKEDLLKRGYTFSSQCDTEVLVAAYDCYGEKCVEKFNGMWAFIIYDKKKQKLFCSRDRFGIKPFYYSEQEGKILFGSEIKQILCMLDEQQSVNRPRLMEYLIRGYSDYTEETMINHIYQLRGGYNMIVDLKSGKLQISRYYDIRNTVKKKMKREEAAALFLSRFKKAINLRLRADVPLGYCLSGGLDSSAIACMADEILKERGEQTKQTSISSCFHDKRYDEQEYIDEVLAHTEITGKKIFPEGNILFDELDCVIWHMDEPFGSTSMYAQWNVFKEAKNQGLTVMLDGQGADEQLAGYTGFYSVIFAEYLRKFQFHRFFYELRKYKELRASTEKYVKSYKIVIEAIISAYLPRSIQKAGKLRFFYLKKEMPFESEDIKKVIKGINLYPANNSRQYILDQLECNLSMLLRYEDRNSMAHSVESRVPFLDYELAEVAFSMPIECKLHDGITKSVMRDALKGILPEKIRMRYSKLGFVTPEDQWINDNPELFRREIESAADALYPLLQKKHVMEWYEHMQGNVQRMDFMPFRIICAGHWVKVFGLKV